MKRVKNRAPKRQKQRSKKPKEKNFSRLISSDNDKLEDLLGQAFRNQQDGKLREAAALYRRALKQNPNHGVALHMLGVISYQCGDPDEAVILVSKAVQLHPNDPEIHNNLGIILNNLSHFDAAIEHFDQALKLRPNYPEALNNKGNALLGQDALENSQDCYQRAISLAPNYAQARANLGAVLMKMEHHESAKTVLESVLNMAPNDPNVLSNYSATLKDLGKYEEALSAANKALSIDPNHFQAINNRGLALQCLNKLADAEASFNAVLRIQPKYAEAYMNLGLTLLLQNRLDDAVEALNHGIEIEPQHPELHLNLGLALLQKGDFLNGWEEYEWRWKMPNFRAFAPHLKAPMWSGEEFRGQTLHIHAEQGFGDTLQFARYVPLVAKSGSKVIFECPKSLSSLFENAGGWEDISIVSEAPIACDAHIPLLSLPRILKTSLETIPADIPYLSATPQSRKEWTDRIGGDCLLKVGLVWKGSHRHERDAWRSPGISGLKQLLDVPGVHWVSLQKDDEIEDLKSEGVSEGIVVLGNSFRNFSDTAAALANLDLVISPDTAVAHLAGALGIPVWVLIPHASDWRWLCDRSDSPWYPTMKLWRQPSAGNWQSVIEDLAVALQKHAFEIAQ